MDEIEIVNGCLKNDRAAQKALYDLYFSSMLGICLRYATNEEEANDIVHDGFLKVYLGLKNFHNSGSLEGWIRRIMVNTAIDSLRKGKQNYQIASTVYANDITDDVNQIPDDTEILDNVEKEEILKAVQELTPAYRTIFNLFVVEEYTHKEIAEMLEISEGTSKSNLSKAKYNLRKNLTHLIKAPK